MAIVKQISGILNDAFKDAMGARDINSATTTDIVSMGKTIDEFDLYEPWFKSLTNRIVKTVYFVRNYAASTRSILRDEHEYGAFIQKVYYEMPESTDNPEYNFSGSSDSFVQKSPYDVNTTVKATAMIFGGQGTWSVEIVRPVDQIRTAFTSDVEMMRFIDGIYTVVENRYKKDEEDLVNLACATGMAGAIKSGYSRNLLAEYNIAHPDVTLTSSEAMESLSFLKYAAKEIKHDMSMMKKMSVNYNAANYETFTDDSRMIIEMLDEFVAASEMYLQADTFHDALVKLPHFESIPYWQAPGSGADAGKFAKTSAINIIHADIDDGTPVEQAGIIAFIHDIDYVAAYFGHRRTWEKYNERSDVMIHGETARKGYSIDSHANAAVYYIAD